MKMQELYYWAGKKEVDFIQKEKAYQVSLTKAEGFDELKKKFKYIKTTKTITSKNFEKSGIFNIQKSN